MLIDKGKLKYSVRNHSETTTLSIPDLCRERNNYLNYRRFKKKFSP